MSDGFDPAVVGRRMAEALGDGPSAQQRLSQRERLIRAAGTPIRSHRRAWLPWLVAMATTAVVLATVVGLGWVGREATTDPALAEVGEQSADDGQWLHAPPTGDVQFDLPEGTWVRATEGARARVSTPEPDRGRISLESGRIEAEVKPEAKRTWTVEAGPYEVRVVGTVFSVQWIPASGEMEVEVVRGKVIVTGESLGAEAIAVEAGHLLHANHGQRTVTLRPRQPVAEPSDEPAQGTTSDEPEIEEPARPRQQGRRPSRVPSWKDEAEAANYRRALELAKERGVQRLFTDLSSSDLLLLADTARLARDRALARDAYREVRSRFAGTAQAARAAFQLGRLSADHGGKHEEAVRWFRTYLDESPDGTFAREARGRLVQSLRASGDDADARKAARVYLEHYPRGPHAELARSLAGGGP